MLPRFALALLILAAAAGLGFDLGVGAFEVGSDRVILWTRVAPEPPGTGNVTVRVEVATDPAFRHVVRVAKGKARRKHDHTVRVAVEGLRSDTEYWYRFHAGKVRKAKFKKAKARGSGKAKQGRAAAPPRTSPVGAFRTARRPDDGGPVRFVISGDSNIGYTGANGYDFHVLSAAAADAPDFFVYFGDTIYSDLGALPSPAVSLDEYRQVHRLTRADPHLKKLLGTTGTLTGWDDHEVRNDYAGQTVEPERFLAGARAFFEYLPVRAEKVEKAPYRTDRRVRWGKHLELFLVDGRQFRSAEIFCNPAPLADGPETSETLFSPFPQDDEIAARLLPPALFEAALPLLAPNDEACVEDLLAAPGRTLLGRRQLAELQDALLESDASFKVIVNNTPLSTLLFTPYDRWEGYLAERAELLHFLETRLDPSRTLVLTTDFHLNLGVRRPEMTEVLVGPIGQETFGASVAGLVPPDLAPQAGVILALIGGLLNEANGGNALAGYAPDAFSYAVVDVFEDEAGAPHLEVSVRGNPSYALGANDPADVVELFRVELP